MGRLIPLLLRPPTDIKGLSISSPSKSTVMLPAFPAKSIDRPRPGPVTSLTIFPYTEGEWREVMEEVKLLYVRHKYKQCSARCIQILEGGKDTYQDHPLYQIYLSFYTASSLEIISRSLHLNSSTKLPLLQDSLRYYQSAESHMKFDSFSTEPAIVQAVHQSDHISDYSPSSSVRSSVDSVFSSSRSSTSTFISVTPPPTPPYYSTTFSSLDTTRRTADKSAVSAPPRTHSADLASTPVKTKKKVSFSLQLSEAEQELADDATLIDAFPRPPSTPIFTSPPATPSSIADFISSRALIRYRGHLSDLHHQINFHLKSVESQIIALKHARKSWRSNLPTLFTDFHSNGGLDAVGEEEAKKRDLRARIDRLKADGWQRKRFDGSRYRALCEKAIMELGDWHGDN